MAKACALSAVYCEHGGGKSNSDGVYSLNINSKNLEKISNVEESLVFYVVLLDFISEVEKYENESIFGGGLAKM